MYPTIEHLVGLGASRADAARLAEAIAEASIHYQITTPARAAAFLAQVFHESGRLRYLREIWGPTPAQLRYEGRKDLGNVKAGDGSRFRGRGLIQVTGRANYARMRDFLRRTVHAVPDFELDPEAMEQPKWAAYSAAAYWAARGLNDLADAGKFNDITRRINGGFNGKADRDALYKLAKRLVA